MNRLFAVLLFLTPVAVFAEQQPQPSALETALGQRVMSEVNGNIQATSTIVELQRQLKAAQERIKALEDKYEKKDDKTK